VGRNPKNAAYSSNGTAFEQEGKAIKTAYEEIVVRNIQQKLKIC